LLEGGMVEPSDKAIAEAVRLNMAMAPEGAEPNLVEVIKESPALFVTLLNHARTLDEKWALEEALEFTLSDTQRLLRQCDVEGVCRSPDMCFEYGLTARCGPCAREAAAARGVSPLLDLPNLPEVSRLRRELDGKLAELAMMRDALRPFAAMTTAAEHLAVAGKPCAALVAKQRGFYVLRCQQERDSAILAARAILAPIGGGGGV